MTTSELPFVVALCPTFRHPKLLANSLWLWLRQDYPIEKRQLIILDDAGTYKTVQSGTGWRMLSTNKRANSLPEKYNMLLGMVPWGTENVLIWEDDDIYLKNYVSTHVKVLKQHELSKPAKVFTDCGPNATIQSENGAGRFHSNMGFKHDLIKRVGGWPVTQQQNFDLQLIDLLFKNAKSVGQWEDVDPIPFIYCWNTGEAHCQWTMDGDGKSVTWYEKAEKAYKPVPYVGTLEPKLDARTKKILEQLGEI
jgi:hypothetical protein